MNPRESSPAPPAPAGEAPPGLSIRESFARLVDSGRDLVSAEIEWARLRGQVAATCLRDAALLGVTACLLALAAMVALLVGLILILQPLLGSGWAVVAVVGAALAVAGLLGWLAARRAAAMFRDEP